MSLALAIPLRAAEVNPLAALLGVRSLPPQHALLADPTPDAQLNLRVLEREALRLRYGEALDVESVLGDRADATFALQSKEATKFVRWLADTGLVFPVTVPDVIRYLRHLADAGITWSGIKRAKYGIESLARAVGVGEHVTHHRLVAQTMRGIAREVGRAPTYQKAPLFPDNLRAALPYFAQLALTEPLRAARDLAMASWGIATAQRGDEMMHAVVQNMTQHRLGLVYVMTHGKTIQHARDAVTITIGRTADARICPVETYLRYAELARLDVPGPLFRGVCADGINSKRVTITRPELTRALKAIAVAVGLDPETVSTHSLRIGSANAARRAGLNREGIKAITRHKDDAVLDHYMRPDPFEGGDFTDRMFS